MPDLIWLYIYFGLYILAGSLLTLMISHTWFNRKLLHLEHMLPLLIASWFWLTGQLFEYIIPVSGVKLFLLYLQYTGIVFLPYGWIYFVLNHTTGRPPKKWLYLLLAVPLLGMLLLIYTNPGHKLIWQNIYRQADDIFLVRELGRGIWLLIVYMAGYLTAGVILLFCKIGHTNQYERKRTLVILYICALPVGTSIVDFLLMISRSFIQVTPLAMSAASLFMLYFARMRYYRTIPLTQHLVTQSLLDVCLILDPDNIIIYGNPAANRVINLPVEEIIGKPLALVFGRLQQAIETELGKQAAHFDITIGGSHYHASISPIYGSRNRLINRVILLRDITPLKKSEESLRFMKEQLERLVKERTQALERTNAALMEEIEEHRITETKLNASLVEKNILMGEIHHRVKNNLQVIISMLKLQMRYIHDKKGLEGFNTAISRIKAIAIIHEKLYKTSDLSHTNVAEYIRDLVSYLVQSFKSESVHIDLNLDVEDIFLDLDRCILVGIIINELVSNALKHAFPADREIGQGIIRIYFHAEEKLFIFGVMDNGIGLPRDRDPAADESLGMKIVTTLCSQLAGELTIAGEQGTDVSVRFLK